MKHLTLHLPDTLDLDEKEIVMFLSAKLYESGRLSLGQAAELVGLTKKTFAESLGKFNVSIFNFPPSDLGRDVRNA